MNMAVSEISPIDDRSWQQLLDTTAHDVFHTSAWLGAVARTYGFDARAVVIRDGDQVVAGMPFVRVEGLGGPRVVVGPFSDYCDPLVADPGAWPALAAWIDRQDVPVRVRSLRWRPPPTQSALASAGKAHWHGLRVESDPDDMLAGMRKSARRDIRKAARSPIEVVVGESLKDLREFHQIHVDVRRQKYRLLAQPFAFFEAIWDSFVAKGQGELKLARLDGETVAGVLFLTHGDRRYYKFSASKPGQREVSPNDAIVWSAIQDAVTSGVRLIDFGLSDWDQDGLARYKAKFGADSGEIAFMTGGTPVAAPAVAEVFEPLTELLTDPDVPSDVTVRAGELLYRWFV